MSSVVPECPQPTTKSGPPRSARARAAAARPPPPPPRARRDALKSAGFIHASVARAFMPHVAGMPSSSAMNGHASIACRKIEYCDATT